MSHNIRSKTYMQVAAHERTHRAQIIQVALGLLVLLTILLWNQMAQVNDTADRATVENHTTTAVVTFAPDFQFEN